MIHTSVDEGLQRIKAATFDAVKQAERMEVAGARRLTILKALGSRIRSIHRERAGLGKSTEQPGR